MYQNKMGILPDNLPCHFVADVTKQTLNAIIAPAQMRRDHSKNLHCPSS